MPKERIEGPGSFNYHFPMLAAIVTVKYGNKENAMAAAWHSPFSFSPALYGVMIHPKRFTCQLILEAKEFGVNFMPLEKGELVASVGGSRGAEIDKFQRFKIAKEPSLRLVGAPILKDAYAAYECRLMEHRAYGDHELLIGEVVAVHYDKEAFAEKGLNISGVSPLLYLEGDLYATLARDTVCHWDRQVYGKKA